MALINCPECGKEISDKVKSCPNCGYPITNETQQVEVSGISLIKNDTPQKKKKRKVIIISFIVLLILGISSGIYINQKLNVEKENMYKLNLYLTTYQMLSNAAEMEDMTNTVKTTWSNAIDHRRDFNDELAELYSKNAYNQFNNQLNELEDASTTLDSNMKDLQNPPEKYKDAYNKLLDLYQIYTGLYNQTKSPSGSLVTYSSDVNNKIDSFLSTFKQIQVLLPDLESTVKSYNSTSK